MRPIHRLVLLSLLIIGSFSCLQLVLNTTTSKQNRQDNPTHVVDPTLHLKNGLHSHSTISEATDSEKERGFVSSVIALDNAEPDKAAPNKLPVYAPSPVEKYILDNAISLGYNVSMREELKPTCTLWNDTTLSFHDNLTFYRKELDDYARRIQEFEPIPKDLRKSIQRDNNHNVCDSLELDPNGLAGIFSSSRQLSFGSTFGFIEPLLPPMRHPNFCIYNDQARKHILNMDFLVHDFAKMCRQLQPTSRLVFVDMGASLSFHSKRNNIQPPALQLLNLYRKFGFHFDHVYAFEVTPKPPAEIYQAIPEHLLAFYHWINVGVESDPQSRLNPLKLLLDNFDEHDFVVIKLDIDSSWIEVPLAMQVLQDERFSGLIDHFYFEHHVMIQELAPYWASSMNGTLLESLELFTGLREKGIAAHSWV